MCYVKCLLFRKLIKTIPVPPKLQAPAEKIQNKTKQKTKQNKTEQENKNKTNQNKNTNQKKLSKQINS